MSEGRVTVGDRDLPAEIKALADEIGLLWLVVKLVATPEQRRLIDEMRKTLHEGDGDE